MSVCKIQMFKLRLAGLTTGLFCALCLRIPLLMAAEAHGEAHGSGESSGGLPQFDPSTYASQVFWLTITFVILYVFFANKTLPDISGILENRRLHVQSDLETSEKIKTEAENAQKSYEENLEKARTEAARITMDVSDKIKTKTARSYKLFREEADKNVEALEKRLHKAKKEAMEDMNTIAAELASEAAEKIVGISTDIKQAKTVVDALNRRKAA